MAVGLTSFQAQAFLTSLPATVYVKLHKNSPGPDPGAAGATSPSVETTRKAVTLAAASGGTRSASTQPSWTSWTAGTETISHISIWDALTAGNCLWTGALSSSKTVSNGDTLTLTSLSFSLTPLAA